MNDNQHEELRTWLGPYVLGHLTPAERETVEEHLDGCAACTVELAELTPVATALGHVRRRTAVEEQAPAELGDRVVESVTRAARNERRRELRRSTTWAVAAVAALVLGVLGGIGLANLQDDPDGPMIPLESVAVRALDRDVAASADLVDHTWGVEVKLTASGFDRGARYRVAVLGTDGRRYPAGGFVGTGAKEMDCNLNAFVLRDQTKGFEVRDTSGAVVLSSAF